MPGGARSFHFSSNDGTGRFHFTDPDELFRNIFRNGGMGSGMDDGMDGLFASMGGGTRPAGSSRSSRGMRGSFGESMHGMRSTTPEVTTVERPLPVTLEELFQGTTKKMKIKRKTFDENGKIQRTDTVLEVPIKPGLKKGSKIKFKGVGDQEEGGQQDLHFIVEEVNKAFFFLVLIYF